MSNKIIDTHPSITHYSDLNQICKPLERLHGIDYFAHVNVDKKGNFTALGKKPDFVRHYLEAKYYNHDIHLSDADVKIEHVIQDSVVHYGKTNLLFSDCAQFKLHHLFTIVHKNKNSVDAYHFATSIRNNKINEVYLRFLPFLQQFISHFKEQVKSNNELNNAYNYKYRIDDHLAAYKSDIKYLKNKTNIQEFIDSVKPKRYHLLDDESNYITKREFECLVWLHHGKTADEIAAILGITERTVRAHVNSIKSKLKCHTMFQLGEKVSEHNLLYLINQYKNQ